LRQRQTTFLLPVVCSTGHDGARTAGLAVLVIGLLLVGCSKEPPSVAEMPSPSATTDALHTIDPPSGPGAMAPNLMPTEDGVLLTWLQPTGDSKGHTLYFSELAGERWAPAHQITAGEDFFANWADLPALVETADGSRFAHWLRKLGDETYAYGVALSRSRDGGETWQELGWLHDDQSPTEHGFVSYAALPEGGVQVFWLDGRGMPDGGGMQLRTARLADRGPEGSTLLDDRVCECCTTDAALTADGPLVVYRNRSPSEVRDIAVVRATDEGWSEPALIHQDGWQIHGCPVNGPAIAADGDRVAIAWFTAGGAKARVMTTFSSDAGKSFAEPTVIDNAMPLGRVDVALDEDGQALVSWMASSGEGAEVRWQRVASDGARGPQHVATATTAKRSAGVPRMIRHGDRLLFAWVEDGEPSRLRAAFVPLR